MEISGSNKAAGQKTAGHGASAVRQHLASLATAASEQTGIVQAVRFVMGNYSNTGVARPLECETRHVDLNGFSGEWFIPPNPNPTHRNLYLHGGGWVAGSVDTHRHLVDAIAMVSGRATFAANYRLAPEDPFPSGLEDCNSALAWVFKNGPGSSSTAAHVAAIGDSAGGNMVAAMTVNALLKGSVLPSALVMLSPVTDFRPYSKAAQGLDDIICSEAGFVALGDTYLNGVTTVDDARVSPLAATNEVLARFPPTLLQTTSDEYLRDQVVSFAAALWNSGVPVQLSVTPNMPHAYHLFPQELAQAQRAIREVGEFLSLFSAD